MANSAVKKEKADTAPAVPEVKTENSNSLLWFIAGGLLAIIVVGTLGAILLSRKTRRECLVVEAEK